MNGKKITVFMLSLTCVVAFVLLGEIRAQSSDLTGRDVSKEELIEKLKPPSYRGIKPVTSSPVPPPQEEPRVAISVLFETNSANISPKAAQNLDSLGHALQSEQLAPYRFRIEGHTDSVGTEEYNMGLSQRRAKSVKQYLISNFGVKSERLVTSGYGEEKPIADNATSEGRRKNRRVEIVTIGKM